MDSSILRFHVPLIILGPCPSCAPRVLDAVASELDVLPTVASLIGLPYKNTTLGRDLFDPRFDQARYAFVNGVHLSQPRIGLVSRDLFVRLAPDGGEREIWDLEAGVLNAQPDPAVAAKADEMTALARGLFESARYLMYHNATSEDTGKPSPATR
jgi:arylsulfatase A-like enzyme